MTTRCAAATSTVTTRPARWAAELSPSSATSQRKTSIVSWISQPGTARTVQYATALRLTRLAGGRSVVEATGESCHESRVRTGARRPESTTTNVTAVGSAGPVQLLARRAGRVGAAHA